MSTRISGSPSTPQNPQVTNDPGIGPVGPQTATAAATPASPSKPSPYLDAFEPDDSAKNTEFNESKLLSTSTPDSKAQEFSVKDAIVAKADSTNSTSGISAAPIYEKDLTPLENRKDVKILTKLLVDNDGKLPSKLDQALNVSGFFTEASSMFQLLDLADNKQALHKILSNVEGSSPQQADKLLAAIEDKIRVHIGNIILTNLEPKVQDIKASIAELNKDASSRRDFLSNLASQTGDISVIQNELENAGLTEKDANKLASVLAQAHGDSDKISAIATGDVGERKWNAPGGAHSEFASSEKQLQKSLDQLDSSADYLLKNAGNSHLKASRLLINPNVEVIRNEVIKDFAALSPPEYAKTIDRIVNEGVTGAQKDKQFEKDQSFLIMEALNLGIKAFKPLPPLEKTLSILANGPSMIVADNDVDLAHVANKAGAGTAKNVENAVTNKQKLSDDIITDQLMGAANISDDIQFGARLSRHLSD